MSTAARPLRFDGREHRMRRPFRPSPTYRPAGDRSPYAILRGPIYHRAPGSAETLAIQNAAAAELKLRAERRLGELLGETVRKGGVPMLQRETSLPDGISRTQSHRWQLVASVPEALRIYTMQKQLGKDAELSAAEIVRRAERCIGLAIRRGQAEGRINNATGDQRSRAHLDQRADGTLISPTPFVGENKERRDTYAMTDGVSADQFETALSKAKSERNLSRANVVRKVRGNGKAAPGGSGSRRAPAVRFTRPRLGWGGLARPGGPGASRGDGGPRGEQPTPARSAASTMPCG